MSVKKLFTNNKTADPNRGALVGAAIQLGQRAWAAGQNVEAALTAAGYARYVVEGALNYFQASGYEEYVPNLSQRSSTENENLEMAPRTKRQRVGDKSKVPVAPSVKKYVQRCMDRVIEDKFYYKTFNFNPIGTSGSVDGDVVSNIVQGTSDDQRIGNMIHVRSFNLRYVVYDTVGSTTRVVIGYDKQSNGTQPVVGDVLVTNDVNAAYNHNLVVGAGGQRYVIMHDKRHVVNPGTTALNAQALGFRKWSGKKTTTFVASTGAITDVYTGGWFIMCISTSTTAGISATIDMLYIDN